MSSQDPLFQIGCRETREHLHRHVEGETEAFVRRLIEEHLRHCLACRQARAELEDERRMVLEMAIATPALSSTFRSKILERIEGRRESSRRSRWREVFFRASGVAAALLVAAVARFAHREEPRPLPVRATEETFAALSRVVPAEGRSDRAEVAVAAPAPRVVEARWASAESPSIPHLGAVVHAAASLGRVGSLPPAPRDWSYPCVPDPNRDGRMDLNDVAFSCQCLIGGAPPAPLEEPGRPAPDPDCEDICLRV